MRVEIEITDRRLFDIIGEANIAYWGESHKDTGSFTIRKMLKPGTDAEIRVFEHDGDICVNQEHALTHTKIASAIVLAAKKFPHVLVQLLDEDKSDMYTGDILIQLALFGEEKYA